MINIVARLIYETKNHLVVDIIIGMLYIKITKLYDKSDIYRDELWRESINQQEMLPYSCDLIMNFI